MTQAESRVAPWAPSLACPLPVTLQCPITFGDTSGAWGWAALAPHPGAGLRPQRDALGFGARSSLSYFWQSHPEATSSSR